MEAPDNDDADTEAPTEESDYDPFAGAQVRRKKNGVNPIHMFLRV